MTEQTRERVEATTVSALDYTPDDGGMMDAWLDLYQDEWIYVPQLRTWYGWAGTHWREDTTGGAGRKIQHMLAGFNRALRMSLNGSEEDNKKKRAHIAATRRSRSRVSSIEALAANELGIEAGALDRTDVVNFANGSFDLDTLELRKHRADDLLTNCLPYRYDPRAETPAWSQYLKHLPAESVAFLQEFAGYALTTDTRFELAVWLYGPPGSGKSTFIAAIQEALGYRCGLLSLSAIESDRFALANIPGKTLLVSTEQPALHMRATHVVNALISGEPLTIDQKFRDAYSLTPFAKLLWAMNRFPIVNDTNDGVFRRVKVVRFAQVDRVQADLKEKLVEERAGIFNWMVEGLRRLRERGQFEIPEEVQAATREFVEENDIVRAFVKEHCVIGQDYEEASSSLHDAFSAWCLENEFKPLSPYRLAQEWKRLGFEKYKAISGMKWSGLKLLR